MILDARIRRATPGGEINVETVPLTWRAEHSAVIICDMWEDGLACVSAARRVAALGPAVNRVVSALRERGALIIHAPSDCMAFYRDAPGRRRAQQAPFADARVPFGWNDLDANREAPLPMIVSHDEPCSCDAPAPCCSTPSLSPWTRQVASIDIAEEDAVTDDGQEVFNLLVERDADLVFLMGVHLNRCVLGRPFGIRQLVYLGRQPILCRDLTDSYHREPGGHARGTERVIEHIERYWCPSVTSNQLVGGQPFRFDGNG